MCVSDNVLEAFKLRENKVLELIKSCNIVFNEIGVLEVMLEIILKRQVILIFA